MRIENGLAQPFSFQAFMIINWYHRSIFLYTGSIGVDQDEVRLGYILIKGSSTVSRVQCSIYEECIDMKNMKNKQEGRLLADLSCFAKYKSYSGLKYGRVPSKRRGRILKLFPKSLIVLIYMKCCTLSRTCRREGFSDQQKSLIIHKEFRGIPFTTRK